MTSEFPGTMTGTETAAMVLRQPTRLDDYCLRARRALPRSASSEQILQSAYALARLDYLQLVEPLVKMKLNLLATLPSPGVVFNPDGSFNHMSSHPDTVKVLGSIDEQIAYIAKQFQL